MRVFTLFFFVLLFMTSAFINCSLYGSISRIPHFGTSFTDYAEKERDVFLLMYIAGGRLLPQNEKISEISISLIRRAYKKNFQGTVTHNEQPNPYATGKTFDLSAASTRLLYWVPPLALALLLIVPLIPRPKQSIEDEKQLIADF